MNKKHLYLLTCCLSIGGIAVFLFKFIVLGFPIIPDATIEVWNAEARITFQANNKPVKLSMFIPSNSKRFTLTNESFISRGYGLNMSSNKGNRLAKWSTRQAKGLQTLYYKTVIRKKDLKEPDISIKNFEFRSHEFSGPALTAAQELLSSIKARSADVESLVSELIKRLNLEKPDDSISFLLNNQHTTFHKMDLAVRILSYEKIPARIVNGIELEELERRTEIIHWLEAHDGKQWVSFHPQTGESDIPENYFPWWRGKEPIGNINSGKNLRINISVSLNEEAAIQTAIERSRLVSPLLVDFSLYSLPIDTQAVYHILLLIPLGAFLLVILRNVVGFKTFGTFMPVLIALAFRETKLVWGIILFTSIVALGLSIRFYFEHLKLLLVPRLASLLTVVILIMAAISVLSHKIGLERGLSIALFPMVILTMTIERMSVVWEERGSYEAIQQGIGSLFVAALSYVIMTNSLIEHIVFVFPETLFIVLSATLLLGRYSGYRIWELIRFKVLSK